MTAQRWHIPSMQSKQSTHKRQKQYFEQKKRQTQRHSQLQTHPDSDAAADGPTLRQNHSLDVLSLHNLTQQHQSVCVSGTNHLKGHNSTVKDRFRNDPPATFKSSTSCETSIQCMGTGPLPAYQVEGVPTEKEVLTVKGKPPNDRMGNSWVGPAEHMSVLDLLGDDQSNADSKSDPFNEDHVEFSLYGLDRVGTESPFCSPQHDNRKCSYGFPSLMKNPDNLDLLKDPDQHLHDFDAKLDSMIEGMGFFSGWDSFGLLTGMMESRNIPHWKKPYHWDGMDINCKDVGGTTSSGWRKFHHSFNNSGEDIWDSSPLPSSSQRSLEETDRYYTLEEHSRQSLTMISPGSEESCSSSAVKDQGTNNLSLNSKWRHGNGKHGTACCSPGVGIGEARRWGWMPKPSRTSMHSTADPPEENSLNNDWLAEKGYQSNHGNVNFNPLCGSSNGKKDSAARQKKHLSKIQQEAFNSFDFNYEVHKGKIGPIPIGREPTSDVNYVDGIGKAYETRNADSMGTTFCLEGKCRDEFISADNEENLCSAEPNDPFWRKRLAHNQCGQENIDCNSSHKGMMLESCVLFNFYMHAEDTEEAKG